MPGANIVAIVTLGLIASCSPKVIVVTARARGQIFMVANGRADEILGTSPAGVKGL